MKEKLRDYIETIFADAPDTLEIRELKEEMLSHLLDRYDDLVHSGKSEAAAFNQAIAGIGDVSALIRETAEGTGVEYVGEEAPADAAAARNSENASILTPEEQREVRQYKSRSAVLTSVAIALYILCVIPVILLENVLPMGGVVAMFFMIAIATCLLIYTSMSKPECMSRKETGRFRNRDIDRSDATKRNPLFQAINTALWLLTVGIYLGVSFFTHAWKITWMIFLIAVAVENVIRACFDLRRK